MTSQDINIALNKGTPIAIPYFDNIKIEIGEGFKFPSERSVEIVQNFLSLDKENRLLDSRHLFAYYSDTRDAVGGEDWMDDEFGKIEQPEDVWKHITPKSISLEKRSSVFDVPNTADDLYVVLEADCPWDDEHGVLMSWHLGKTLVKVGGYDGSPVNYIPDYLDEKKKEALAGVVYYGNEDFATY